MLSSFNAVVLAGGHSTRMGRDKALLEIAGTPLWQRQRDVLQAAGAADVWLSARPDQTWAHQATGFASRLDDSVLEGGPLAGISAALEVTGHAHLAVLAIDLPAMEAAWFAELAKECRAGLGVVGRRDGFFEPLAAIYPRELTALAREAMGRGEFSVQRWVAAGVDQGLLRVREIDAAVAPLFANWNREADFRRAAE